MYMALFLQEVLIPAAPNPQVAVEQSKPLVAKAFHSNPNTRQILMDGKEADGLSFLQMIDGSIYLIDHDRRKTATAKNLGDAAELIAELYKETHSDGSRFVLKMLREVAKELKQEKPEKTDMSIVKKVLEVTEEIEQC